MKTAALVAIAAGAGALAIVLAGRLKNAKAETEAAKRSLADAQETITHLRDSLPVWFLAGVPLVEVYPTADDFCLN